MAAIENEAMFFCNEDEYKIPWQQQLSEELGVVIIEVTETGMVIPRKKIYTACMVIVSVNNIRKNGLGLIEAIKIRNPKIIITIVSKSIDDPLPIEYVCGYMWMIDRIHNPNKEPDIYLPSQRYDTSLITEKRIPLIIISSGDGVPEIIHFDDIFHDVDLSDLLHFLYMSVVRTLNRKYDQYHDSVLLREFTLRLKVPGEYNLLVVSLAKGEKLILVCYLLSNLVTDTLPPISKLQGLHAMIRDNTEINEGFNLDNTDRKNLIDILRASIDGANE